MHSPFVAAAITALLIAIGVAPMPAAADSAVPAAQADPAKPDPAVAQAWNFGSDSSTLAC
jgi:hypothetical protein